VEEIAGGKAEEEIATRKAEEEIEEMGNLKIGGQRVDGGFLRQFVGKNLPIRKLRADLSETRQVFTLKLGR